MFNLLGLVVDKEMLQTRLPYLRRANKNTSDDVDMNISMVVKSFVILLYPSRLFCKIKFLVVNFESTVIVIVTLQSQ